MKPSPAILLLILILLAIPSISKTADVEFGLPDSLQSLDFWDAAGGFTGVAAEASCPPVLDLKVIPDSGIAGAYETYDIQLTLPSSGLPWKGGFAFRFPRDFDLNQIVSVTYSDDDPSPDPEIKYVRVWHRKIVIRFEEGQTASEGTKVVLRIVSVGNPTEAGQYQITGLIFNKYFWVISGPSTSEKFDIYPADPIALFIEPDEPITLMAGTTQLFSTYVIDEYNNMIDYLELTWSLSSESDEIGVLSQGSLLATTIGTGKVVVSSGNLADTSGLITVIPGAINSFEFLEQPQAVDPGEHFQSPVTIAAYDTFDNIKTDYDGSVYFSSSDPLADLYHDSENRYNFTTTDSGRHTFDGNLFSLTTLGVQTLTVTDGQISNTSGPILVGGSQPVSFNIEYDDSVIAGEPLTIYITEAVDSSGNPATAIIDIILIGDGTSPAGYQPIINDVLILGGSGSADQYLFKTGPTVLNAISDTETVEIATIVKSAKLGDFSLDIQPTQFVGNPLIGPASITAFDLFGNVKSDFDASTSPVEFIINRGELTHSVLDNSNDFIDGVADLSQKDIVFVGDGGEVQIYVTSENVSSNWNILIYNGIHLNITRTLPDTVRIGFEGQFGAKLFNPGNRTPLNPIAFDLNFASCSENCTDSWGVSNISPGGTVHTYRLVEITDDLNMPEIDTFVVVMQADYYFEGDTITTTILYEKPITVLESILLEYVENSLSMDTILSPSDIDRLSMQLTPSEGYEFDHPRLAAHLYISNGDGYWTELYYSVVSTLQTGDSDVITLSFSHVSIPDLQTLGWTSEGYGYLRIDGTLYDNGWHAIVPLEKFDSVMVLAASDLSYIDNSLAPLTVFDNTPQSFSMDLNLDGSTYYNLDRYQSRLELGYDDYGVMIVHLVDSFTLTTGANRISTSEIYIPSDLIGKELTPRLVLTGHELYAPRTDTILFGDERISVSEHTSVEPELKIVSTNLLAPNPPFLNHEQEFGIVVSVENLSDSNIDSVSLMIQSEDGSVTYAEVNNISVSSHAIYETTFLLTAPDSSISSLIYKTVASAPENVNILPPVDNTVALTVQSPAEVELTYELTDVYGDFVEYGQVFTIRTQMNNRGEASAGPGRVTLITGGVDFGIEDSTSLLLDIGNTGTFQLTAPALTITADLVLLITETPIDSNISQPAETTTDSILVTINVGPTITDELIGDVIVSPTPLIVPGSTYVMLGLEFLNKTGDSLSQIGLRSIILELTDKHGNIIPADQIVTLKSTGFTNNDSIITTPEIYGERLRLNFNNFRLYPHITDTISFFARINPEISVKSFGLRIDSRDIKAAYVTGPRVNQSVPVTGKFESNFSVTSNFIIVTGGLEKSLAVRNNPFNPEIGDAEIAYFLNQDSDVEMNIYTLLGEKVCRKFYRAGSIGGSQGENRIRWDGRNDEGRMVLNGVYIVIIEAKNSGESYRLKLAVMK